MERREFLTRTAATALAAVTPAAALGSTANSESLPAASDSNPNAPSTVNLDTRQTVATVSPYLFGSFLEHLGRAIYDGIYQPGSPLSDAHGFRKDVVAEVRELGVPLIRYPGGNFVSGYFWQDGIGPKAQRPRILDRAWDSLETNQVGVDEFMAWCKLAGARPLMAVNLGSDTPMNASNLVEYCNVPQGTKWSDMRRANGVSQPYGIHHWCLGNEMDGPWQIGHCDATAYGYRAADAARQMKAVDPGIKVTACGSSSPGMPTYLEWERQVLEQCYEVVDYLSLHRYFNLPQKDEKPDYPRFLAQNLELDREVAQVGAVCDLVGARLKSRKTLRLSFDEWNVWYGSTGGDGKRKYAPHLIEETYNLGDALLVGGCINSLLRNAKRIEIACLAQLVNVIAPLMTNDQGVLRQTTYFPYRWALQLARGEVLAISHNGPGYETEPLGMAPYLDVVATLDNNRLCLLALNRDTSRTRTMECHFTAAHPGRILSAFTLTGSDLTATNTFAQPKNVLPERLPLPAPGRRMTIELPAQSYSVMQFELA